MKKSNRYATRYTARLKREMEEYAENLWMAKAMIANLKGLLSKAEDKIKEVRAVNRQDRGITTIKIGKEVLGLHPGGQILGISLMINLEEFRWQMIRGANGSTYDITSIVRQHSMDVCRKLEKGILEHLERYP